MNSGEVWWAQRESNPRPTGCKPVALNQLSYAPDVSYKRTISYQERHVFFIARIAKAILDTNISYAPDVSYKRTP